MKHFVKSLILASASMLVLSSCTELPGTQEWKVKKAATTFVERDLKDGETMNWEGNGLRLHLQVKGKTCTYAEAKYTITANGIDTHRKLYLLLSENCDSLYDASDTRDGEVWKFVDEALKNSLKEATKEIDEELKNAWK